MEYTGRSAPRISKARSTKCIGSGVSSLRPISTLVMTFTRLFSPSGVSKNITLYFSSSLRSALLSRYMYSDTSTTGSSFATALAVVRKASTSSVSGFTIRPISVWSGFSAVSGELPIHQTCQPSFMPPSISPLTIVPWGRSPPFMAQSLTAS